VNFQMEQKANDSTAGQTRSNLEVCHIVKGVASTAADEIHHASDGFSFSTPSLDLKQLTWPRHEPCPAFGVPIQEIIDLLVETGKALARDEGGYLSTALSNLEKTSSAEEARLSRRLYEDVPLLFNADIIRGSIEAELGGLDVLDGWREVGIDGHPKGRIRAYPARMVHVLAGNAPVVASMTVIRCAVTRGASLLKLPSNDLFTAPAILQTMAAIAPDHPVVKSFSAVYWRGGDERVEGALMRAQFFDKLVAWGGDSAIRGAIKYLGPGLELVSFDPKNSISMIGAEAFASEQTMKAVAASAAADVTFYNQLACAAARFQFVEGSREQVDTFCEALLPELSVERDMNTAVGQPVPESLAEEISALKYLEPEYRVWGDFSGRGVVVRSEEPVDFYPDFRVVNVVRVDDLADAIKWVNVSTQTVGIYPDQRRRQLVDGIANAGAQCVQPLGCINKFVVGTPHDGMFPLHRFVRWVSDKD